MSEQLTKMTGMRQVIDWRPIETAPKDGTRVLLFMPGGHGGQDVQFGHWRNSQTYSHGKLVSSHEEWVVGNMIFAFGAPPVPTFWAPAPAGPFGIEGAA